MQITDQVHALRILFQVPVSPDVKLDRFVYVYLLNSEGIWLIDTGVASAEPVISDYIRSTGKDMRDIRGIILTHSHPDHIGSANSIQRASGCIVAAHKEERAWIEDVELQARERPVPGFHDLVRGSIKLSRLLKEGDVIDLEKNLKLEILETPGHSKGSISLLLRDQGILFSGDAVPISGEMPIYEDAIASADSVRKLRKISGINWLLASWDDPRQGSSAYERLDQGLDYLNRIHQAVLQVYRAGPTGDAMELCNRVLGYLHLPPAMANPLVAHSFQADLESERQAGSAS